MKKFVLRYEDKRTLAFLVDFSFVALVCCAAVFLARAADVVASLDFLHQKGNVIFGVASALFIYFSIMEGRSQHASLGKKLFGLTLVSSPQKPPRIGQILWRNFAFAILIQLFWLSFLLPLIVLVVTLKLFDKRLPQDIVTGTLVVEV